MTWYYIISFFSLMNKLPYRWSCMHVLCLYTRLKCKLWELTITTIKHDNRPTTMLLHVYLKKIQKNLELFHIFRYESYTIGNKRWKELPSLLHRRRSLQPPPLNSIQTRFSKQIMINAWFKIMCGCVTIFHLLPTYLDDDYLGEQLQFSMHACLQYRETRFISVHLRNDNL